MAQYNAHYVHKISPRPIPYDSDGPVEIRDKAFSNKNTLAKALRDADILGPGERLHSFRVEGERILVFPMRGIWHAIVLEPADNYVAEGVDYPGYNLKGRGGYR
jgi:hypothetical protein